MEKAVVEMAKALKEGIGNLGVCFDQLLDVVLQHERRLQELESPADLRNELRTILRRIEDIKDQAPRETAMSEFAILCHILGVDELEGV